MSLAEAWKTIGVKPGCSHQEFKKAFRQRIREVHPDITGDDGTMLQKVRDAHDVLNALRDPTSWDALGLEDGLPAWSAGLTNGIKWSDDCKSYAAFLEKPDNKALAVGELNEDTYARPWAAAWGKFSQEEANKEALRVCRQFGTKCKLIYVGSGSARARGATDLTGGENEAQWWSKLFHGQGDYIGFGWMPMIDPKKEKLVGYKTVSGGDRMGATARVRVPVFRPVVGGAPYYYSPLRPKERVIMKDRNFKYIKKLTRKRIKYDPRIKDYMRRVRDTGHWTTKMGGPEDFDE